MLLQTLQNDLFLNNINTQQCPTLLSHKLCYKSLSLLQRNHNIYICDNGYYLISVKGKDSE